MNLDGVWAAGQCIRDGYIFDSNVIGPWVNARTGGGAYLPGSGQGIGRVKNGVLVAGVLFQQHSGVNIMAHIASEGKGWLDRQFLRLIHHYPFIKLGVLRVTGTVPASNTEARRFDEHLGFELEATLKQAAPDGGDLCIYVLWADKSRWLKELNNEKS